MCFNYFHLKAFRTIGESRVTGMTLAFHPTRDGRQFRSFTRAAYVREWGSRCIWKLISMHASSTRKPRFKKFIFQQGRKHSNYYSRTSMFSKETASTQFYKKHLFGATVTALTKRLRRPFWVVWVGLFWAVGRPFGAIVTVFSGWCVGCFWNFCDGCFELLGRVFWSCWDASLEVLCRLFFELLRTVFWSCWESFSELL